MSTGWNVDDLVEWDKRIQEKVAAFGLTCFPQEFEVCDHTQMLGMMAYSGMPSHYPHWSFGKAFERTKTLYDYGVSGIPYEMVINSSPSIAYLMRDNSLCLQILTIAHVYGHNDFFRNNFTFSFTRPETVVQRFKAQAERIRKYVESPSIGEGRVEETLDAAHALAFQCQRNPAIKTLKRDAQIQQALDKAQSPYDEFQHIHKRPVYEAPDLHKLPLDPDENVLLFIRDYNPRLEEWQRDILTIVHERAQYFIPQMETKTMNEGWACYWHRKIMNSLDLPEDIHMEFLVRHNQVVRPIPGQLNPYFVGLKMWDDIVRRCDDPAPEERSNPNYDKPGESLMFEIREVDRDASFFRRFLTEDLMRDMDLFEYKANNLKEYVIDKIADKDNWQKVKQTLIGQTGLAGLPVIRVTDADFDGKHELLLSHAGDGRELDLGYAEKTMAHLYTLWGRAVHLKTTLGDAETLLSYDGEKMTKKVG